MRFAPGALRQGLERAVKEGRERRPGVCLFHIPKTGGTSVAAALRPRFRLRHFNVNSAASSRTAEHLFAMDPGDPGFWEHRQQVRAALAIYAGLKGKRFVTGHIAYGPEFEALREQGLHTATVLRDPVRRWFSAYFYNRYKATAHGRTDLDFDAFLESPEAADLGSTYVRFIGGPRADRDYTSPAAVEQAKANLRQLDIVGFLEDLPALQRDFRGQAGLRLRFPHRRRSPAPPELEQRIKNDPDYRKAVEALCGPDLELYRFARSHHDTG